MFCLIIPKEACVFFFLHSKDVGFKNMFLIGGDALVFTNHWFPENSTDIASPCIFMGFISYSLEYVFY